jgi:transcription elongation factor Elf1
MSYCPACQNYCGSVDEKHLSNVITITCPACGCTFTINNPKSASIVENPIPTGKIILE